MGGRDSAYFLITVRQLANEQCRPSKFLSTYNLLRIGVMVTVKDKDQRTQAAVTLEMIEI